MKLNQLVKTSRFKKKRLGRGIAASGGKTAGRGTKGQKSRSGKNIPRKLSAGKLASILKLPKQKTKKFLKTRYTIVKIDQINKKFKVGEKVTPQILFEKKLIDNPKADVKIVGDGKLTKKLKFQNLKFTKSVKAQIDKLSPKRETGEKEVKTNVSRRRTKRAPKARRTTR